MKKQLSFSLVLAILLSVLTISVSASGGQHFTDVPNNYWAATYINEMAEGGLISGYGGGLFGPNDTFKVDQMATIICNAKGYDAQAKDGYWAYGAVEYCVNTLKCLPNFGKINAETYGIPCTRELALYMLVEGLGAKDNSNANLNITAENIPDYSDITIMYRDTIVKAYRLGLTVGTDAKMTFKPKDVLTRAQAATMFVRAGWTEAATKPTTGEGLTGEQLYAAIKSMGVEWTEADGTLGGKVLTAVDEKYCGLQVNFYNSRVWIMLKEDGVKSFGLTPRLLIKDILEIAFPTESAEAYDAMKACFLQEAHEAGSSYPNALRWLDNRCYTVKLSSPGMALSVSINELNNVGTYNTQKAAKQPVAKLSYPYLAGSDREATIAYELDKW